MSTAEATLTAVDPRSGAALDAYPATQPDELAAVIRAASAAARDPRRADPERRAAALQGAAAALREAGDELRARFEAESGLPPVRAAGELERTCVQLELFADVVLRGDHLEVVIDRADADARPIPRPDLRRMLVPLGPVAVFGASNFPFAFGVAGGDTAAALAAGCPVIAKGHPSQPGVNDLVARCVAEAVAAAGLPAGTFASVQGASRELGEALVDEEGICAVAFTGSTAGGRALFDRAARRPRPIPVYAEMGSTNPAVVTRAALRARAGDIRAALATAITGAAGQLCTKPGVVFVPAGEEGDAFAAGVGADLGAAAPGVLLNERLRDGFAAGIGELAGEDGVEVLTPGTGPTPEGYAHTPAAFSVAARDVAARPELREERFGPAVVLARYGSEEDLLAGVAAFDGQLAGALFAEPEEDAPLLQELTALLSERVGRVVYDAFPTGVAVAWAMHHGGPYPATTAPDHTSVGLTATRRFMRPVCWQSAPQAALPAPLRDENPRGIWRRVDGTLTDAAL